MHPEYGRVVHIQNEEWLHGSQPEELKFWQVTSVPRGNEIQAQMFKNFDFIDRQLGHVLEIGSGPYTKTRLMLETAATLRRPFHVSSVTLQDPMVFTYPGSARHCTYANMTFCPPSHGCVEQVFFTKMLAEQLNFLETFDTVVMMNVKTPLQF